MCVISHEASFLRATPLEPFRVALLGVSGRMRLSLRRPGGRSTILGIFAAVVDYSRRRPPRRLLPHMRVTSTSENEIREVEVSRGGLDVTSSFKFRYRFSFRAYLRRPCAICSGIWIE